MSHPSRAAESRLFVLCSARAQTSERSVWFSNSYLRSAGDIWVIKRPWTRIKTSRTSLAGKICFDLLNPTIYVNRAGGGETESAKTQRGAKAKEWPSFCELSANLFYWILLLYAILASHLHTDCAPSLLAKRPVSSSPAQPRSGTAVFKHSW